MTSFKQKMGTVINRVIYQVLLDHEDWPTFPTKKMIASLEEEGWTNVKVSMRVDHMDMVMIEGTDEEGEEISLCFTMKPLEAEKSRVLH